MEESAIVVTVIIPIACSVVAGVILWWLYQRPRITLRVEREGATVTDGNPEAAALTVTARAEGADMTISRLLILSDNGDRFPVDYLGNQNTEAGQPAAVSLPLTLQQGRERTFRVPVSDIEADLAQRYPSRRGKEARCRVYVEDATRGRTFKSRSFPLIPTS